MRQECLSSQCLFIHVLGTLVSDVRYEKEIKDRRIGKEEKAFPPLFLDNVFICVRDLSNNSSNKVVG